MRVVSEYCCCAIPLFKSGIYVALLTNIVLGITVGTLAVGTTPIVGAAVPSFTKWIMTILCFTAAAVQIFGLIGIAKEKTIMYRRYTTLHCFTTIAIFAVAAVFIGWSGAKHNTAQSNCEKDFFSNTNTTSTTSSPLDTASEGQTLCNIFTWVTFGVMVGIWAILGILEVYLYLVISGYGSSQRDDHARYYAVYSVNDGPNPGDMFLADRSNPRNDDWDPRLSTDEAGPVPHSRKPSYGYGEKPYNDYPSTQAGEKSFPPSTTPYGQQPRKLQNQRSGSRQYSDPSYPTDAYTEDPGPTPTYNNYQQDRRAGSGNTYPYPASLPHPAEGNFGRKTPRNYSEKDMSNYRQRTTFQDY